MSRSTDSRSVKESRAGVLRSEPGGRAQRDGGGAASGGPPEQRVPTAVRELLDDELVDELLAGARTEEEIVGPGGLLAQLTKRLVERAMDVELTEYLGYERGQSPPGWRGQHAQRVDTEDADDRARPGPDRHAAGSRQRL